MAFRKQMLLPFAALLFAGVIAARAANVEPEFAASEEQSIKEAVDQQLQEGEAALAGLLGPEVETMDRLLRPILEEMARTYGVSEAELAAVARDVMERIAAMDPATLQATLGELAGIGGVDMSDPGALQKLLAKLGNPLDADGI